mmetsp:Transcript_4298/g.6439  ORF Transcript_4298/g.6439 Transcript_4298/m.6439 type:complete len:412 (-) Transcript_4298:994-2229(-)
MHNLKFTVRMAHSAGKSAVASPVQSIQRQQLIDSDNSSQSFLSLEKIRQYVNSRQHFVDDEGIPLLTLDNLQDKYKSWMKSFGTLEKYDVFLSYRQSPVDSPLVAAIFDRFTLFNVTTSQRAIEVFLDNQRLEKGREFRDDFSKALTHSAVVVPFLSTKSMERMLKHDAESVDNVLVEWILALVCYNNKELQAMTHIRILPILLGPPDSNNERRRSFNFEDIESVPDIRPLATIVIVKDILKNNSLPVPMELDSYTVRSILKSLTVFNGFLPSDALNQSIVSDTCELVVALLKTFVKDDEDKSRMTSTIKTDESSRQSLNTKLTLDSPPKLMVESPQLTPLSKDFVRAWNIIHDPKKIMKGKEQDLNDYLEDLGVYEANELNDVPVENLLEISKYLKVAGNTAFKTALQLM